MADQRIILLDSDNAYTRAKNVLVDLFNKRREIECHEAIYQPYDPKHTDPQRRYYWSQCVEPLAKHCGYSKEQMHDVILREVFGTKVIEFRGNKHEVPAQRSSKLGKSDYADLITLAQVIAVDLGVAIPPYEFN